MLHRTLFRTPLVAIAAGAVITVMVQSSSVTTSVMVPLVGAGVITLRQLFPFTVGANIGTTVTAMLAALATASPAAITVAFTHLLFNLGGTLLVYASPLRALPLALAGKLGELAAANRAFAGVYVVVVFFGLPLALLLVSGTLSNDRGEEHGALPSRIERQREAADRPPAAVRDIMRAEARPARRPASFARS
jgi:sodium-dependent phosphate cotransporter